MVFLKILWQNLHFYQNQGINKLEGTF